MSSVLQLRDARVLTKPDMDLNTKECRNQFCIYLCNNINALKTQSLLYSETIPVEDRFETIRFAQDKDGEIFGMYKMHDTRDEDLKKNIIWPVLLDNFVRIHVMGAVKKNLCFKYGISFNTMCNSIVYLLCTGSTPSNEPQIISDLNDDDGTRISIPEFNREIHVTETSETQFVKGLLHSDAFFTHLSCRLDAILSKL